jgi:hypothetical protein
MTSVDGITWTIRTQAANNQWRSVTYGNGLFVAVALSGTGNRVMSSGYDVVADAPVISSAILGSTSTVNFTQSSSVYATAISNYQYSTDNGSNWVAVSPAATTSPLTITGLATVPTTILIRAVNSVGNSCPSNNFCVPPTAPTASAQTFVGNKTVADLVATGTDLKWYDVATNGTALTPTSSLTSGNYYVSQTLNSCEGPRTLVAVTVNTPSVATQTVSQCGAYTWPTNNQPYTQSGTYTAVLTNAAGCDSTVTLNLSIKNATTSSTAHTTVNPYTWNGTTYNVPGTYTFTTINAVGCDSIATLDLTFNVFTTVKSNSCNSTLSAMTSYIYANSVSGATKYKFKVTNTITNQVQEIERSSSFISLAMLPSKNYTTPYSVEVAVYKYGRWSPFGQTCVVTSPLAPTTSIIDAQQNSTLAFLTTPIIAKVVNGANGYKFEVF